MSTPTEDHNVPFPRVQEPSGDAQSIQNATDHDSQTSSTGLTSSDKLTALPQPASAGRPRRTARLSQSSVATAQRNYRHSLDATSLASFSVRNLGDEPWLRSPPRSVLIKASASAPNSPGPATPRQRHASEDGDDVHHRHSAVQAALTRLLQSGSRATHSEPSVASPPKRPSPTHKSPESEPAPLSPSRPRSRAASPLRFFQQWSNGHRSHRHEEPFVPINPFKHKGSRRGRPSDEESQGSASAYGCDDIAPVLTIRTFIAEAQFMLLDSAPRQLYLNFLLRLPAMYFTRVSTIFQDAEVSKPDIVRMISATCRDRDIAAEGSQHREFQAFGDHSTRLSPLHHEASPLPKQATPHHRHPGETPLPVPEEWTPTSVSPSLYRFKLSWEAFVDSLLREWKTFNIVSALLSSAIVSTFQVPEAVEDPVTRTAALLSLICALMSLSYGCIYIVRFGTMRSMARASTFAEDAQKMRTSIWWNVWVLLAMPAVWMAWAMVLFMVAILSFVWRTGSAADPPTAGERPALGAHAALGPRIAITAVFILGLVYLFLIISTLKRYGASRGTATDAILRAGKEATATGVAIGEVGSSLAAMAVPTGGGRGSGAGTTTRVRGSARGKGSTKKQPRRRLSIDIERRRAAEMRRGRVGYSFSNQDRDQSLSGGEEGRPSALGLTNMTPASRGVAL